MATGDKEESAQPDSGLDVPPGGSDGNGDDAGQLLNSSSNSEEHADLDFAEEDHPGTGTHKDNDGNKEGTTGVAISNGGGGLQLSSASDVAAANNKGKVVLTPAAPMNGSGRGGGQGNNLLQSFARPRQEVQKRDRNIFALLTGHLKKAKKEEEEDTRGQEKDKENTERYNQRMARMKREEKIELEKKQRREEELLRKRKEREHRLKEKQRERQDILDLRARLEKHYAHMRNFLRTTSGGPTIFYLPKKHSHKTEKLLQESRVQIDKKIASLADTLSLEHLDDSVGSRSEGGEISGLEDEELFMDTEGKGGGGRAIRVGDAPGGHLGGSHVANGGGGGRLQLRSRQQAESRLASEKPGVVLRRRNSPEDDIPRSGNPPLLKRRR